MGSDESGAPGDQAKHTPECARAAPVSSRRAPARSHSPAAKRSEAIYPDRSRRPPGRGD